MKTLEYHKEKHADSGKKFILGDCGTSPGIGELKGKEFILEDWWDHLTGRSWMFTNGNPACIIYAIRSSTMGRKLPVDNEVVYGHVEGLGLLLHTSELEGLSNE